MFKHTPAIIPWFLKKSLVFFWIWVIAGFYPYAMAANLLGHWSLNEPASPYVDSGWSGSSLIQDSATTVAISGTGIAGSGVWLNWQAVPGTSTRLITTNSNFVTDSFGFSFWLNPSYLNNNDNFIAKEMPYTTVVSGDHRMAWQLRVSGVNSGGTSPLELIVRGNNPTNSNFFGNVLSTVNVPLFTGSSNWIHVAGGYNATSGAMTLFVNGQQATSVNSISGAHSSDGSPFVVGTGKNGPDFVVFAAGAYVDDLQFYDGPLTATDVAFLMANPGQDIRPFTITQMTYDSTSGSITATAVSTNCLNMNYVVEASTNVGGFTMVTNLAPCEQKTIITLPKSTVDSIFGIGPRSSLFIRMRMQTDFSDCY
jgi:hypothetical protein